MDVKHRHVLDVDVFYNTATSTGALESQSDIGAQKLAIAYQDVLDTTAHLATYHEASMSFEYGTTIDNDVFARNTTLSSVCILSTLDADAIVANIESGVDNQGIFTGFQVKSVTILCKGRIAHQNILDKHILAHQRMNVPCRRVLEDNAVEPYILAVDEAYHDRT